MNFLSRLGLRKKKSNYVPPKNLIVVPETGQKISGTWYRGPYTNFHPTRANMSEREAISRYICQGWLPSAPMIDREKYITAFGSCFARRVTEFLHKEGYSVFGRDMTLDAHIVRAGDGIVSTEALRQQFEWAFEGWKPSTELWHDKAGEVSAATEEAKRATLEIFHSTDVFIFTLGLSEVWYDKTTGDTFWRAIPQHAFDETRHGFRVLSVEENKRNLTKVYRIIRANRPNAEIILTLSPIPLAATFRPISCVTANSVSKGALRVAIDELMREHPDDAKLHYFPSYEIATIGFPDGLMKDMRHPKPEVVDAIMQVFKQSYLI